MSETRRDYIRDYKETMIDYEGVSKSLRDYYIENIWDYNRLLDTISDYQRLTDY